MDLSFLVFMVFVLVVGGLLCYVLAIAPGLTSPIRPIAQIIILFVCVLIIIGRAGRYHIGFH